MDTTSEKNLRIAEVIVLLAIIVVLGLILIPTFLSTIGGPDGGGVTPLELNQLSNALEAYKAKLGEYPPNFSDTDALVEHIQAAFPRSQDSIDTWLSTEAATRNPKTLDAAEALVFWLSALNVDPRHPLSESEDTYRFFEFDETRLIDVDGDGWHEYGSRCLPNVPYVYIDARSFSSCKYPSSPIDGIEGTARAYKQSSKADERFQIICAGRDGDFGTSQVERVYPDGTGYSDGDLDNITNFSEGMILENAIP